MNVLVEDDLVNGCCWSSKLHWKLKSSHNQDQVCINVKMRATAFAAFGALCNYGVGVHREAFLDQVHLTLPRMILHVHDDNLSVRQACRNTLRCVVNLMEVDNMSAILNMHYFNSDHRSDYEDFLRDVTRLICQHFASRADTYMASIIQAFDAPWATIQANAIYFSSSILSHSDDQRLSTPYFPQVFGMLVGKMSQSPDAIVRATCSSSIGMLLRSTNSLSWKAS